MRLLAITLVTLFVVIFASAEARSVQDVKIAVSFDDKNDAASHERRLMEIENLLSQKCLDLCGDKIGKPLVEKVPSRCNGYRSEESLESFQGCANSKPIVEKIEIPSSCDDDGDRSEEDRSEEDRSEDDRSEDDRSGDKSYEVPEVGDYGNVNQSEPVLEVIEATEYPMTNQSEQVVEIIEAQNDTNTIQTEPVTQIIEIINHNNSEQAEPEPVVEKIVVAPVPATGNNGGATRTGPAFENHNKEWYKAQFDKNRGPKGKHSGEDSDSNESGSGEDDSHERKHKSKKNGSGSDEDDSHERKHKSKKNGSGSDEDDSGEKKRHMVPPPSHGPPKFPPKVRFY